jgi:hypothetical protein
MGSFLIFLVCYLIVNGRKFVYNFGVDQEMILSYGCLPSTIIGHSTPMGQVSPKYFSI